MLSLLWLIPLGFFVGTLGTLIGAGGGFILVPLLLMVYPDKSPETITSISLAVVFFNALSGSLAYKKAKRIDYKSGWIFALSTVPGSILGAYTISYIPRTTFNILFGILLLVLSIFLVLKPSKSNKDKGTPSPQQVTRKIIDADGIEYVFSYNLTLGIVLSILVGYLSSLLGIGGGIIHVPALVHLLNYPIHIATATSHFILVIMALSGSLVHLIKGVLVPGLSLVVPLSFGVIFGAQLGAKLSKKIQGKLIIRALAIALGLVGIRLLFMGFFS